jgi:hypothetical protein
MILELVIIQACLNNKNVDLHILRSRKDGNNCGFDSLLYSSKINLKQYLFNIKNHFVLISALSCHGWAEFCIIKQRFNPHKIK